MARTGARLLNGESQICDIERRRWKADLSTLGVRTPEWVSAEFSGPLMSGAETIKFPAYLKRADHGRGFIRYFESIGDLAEYMQLEHVQGTSVRLESEVEGGRIEKAYVIRNAAEVFVLESGVPSPAAALRGLADIIQVACGLSYFSFDVVWDVHGCPFVIDVNRFAVFGNEEVCWARLANCLWHNM